MKKNAMLKIAAILMVAVLLTTCAISSTFAKYVASGSGETSARVAKWGVKVDSNIFSTAPLFDNEYNGSESSDAKHVYTTNDLLVAPGTEGSMTVDTVITGTPEVAGKVVVTAKFTLSGSWEAKDGESVEFYCPLAINANGTNYSFTSAGQEIIATQDYTFDAGEDLKTVVDDFNLSWAWAFTTGADDAAKAKTDAKDTYLADFTRDGYQAPTIKVQLTFAIEQTPAA